MKIKVQGFASDIIATFKSQASAEAFVGALCELGNPLTEREAIAMADCFGGRVNVLPVVTEHELLALDLIEDAHKAHDTAEALNMLHALIASA
jgi:hypothetical protein